MSLCSRCAFVTNTLEEIFGVRVDPSSRLGSMLRVLCDKDGNPRPEIEPGSVDHAIGRTALLDILPIDLALRVLDREQLDCQPLKRLVKGAVLPQDEPGQSPGRDLQSELYVAAILACAGAFEGFHEPPDIHGAIPGLPFGVAVKRIKSLGKIEANIRDGADQIDRDERPGIITADLSVACNQDNDAIRAMMDDQEFDRRANEAMRTLVHERESNLLDWTRAKDVRGIVFLCHLVRLRAAHEWGLETIHLWFPTARSNQRRSREAESIFKTYRDGANSIERYR